MKRAAEFLWRGTLGALIGYLLWLPLKESLVALVARSAQTALAWLWSPPLVTGLTSAGEFVEVRGLIFGPGQWMGRWDAGFLSLFGVAAVGFALVLPLRDARQRAGLLGGACLGSLLAMVTVAAIQISVVAVNTVSARHGIVLVSSGERSFLSEVLEATSLLEMLLPAVLILAAYLLVSAGPPAGPRSARRAWRGPVLIWALLAALVALLTIGPAPSGQAGGLARLERTAALNPDSPRAWLALARAKQRTPGESGAAAVYRRVLSLDPANGPARVALVQLLLRDRDLSEALLVAQGAPPGLEEAPLLMRREVEILLARGEPCAAFRRARGWDERPGAGQLTRIRDRAEARCRRRTKGSSQGESARVNDPNSL